MARRRIKSKKTKKQIPFPDDKDIRIYKKSDRAISRKRAKYLRRAEHHGSLKSILCRRSALILGVYTILFWGLFIIGMSNVLVMICGVVLPILAVNSIFGKSYRDMLKEYEKYGFGREEAEYDFSESKAYTKFSDVIAVSSRFVIASFEKAVIPVENIVWIYSVYRNVHEYEHKEYSYTRREYFVIIGLSDGKRVVISCPEELYPLIVDDVSNADGFIAVGYSKELKEMYVNDPGNFKAALKSHIDIIKEPVCIGNIKGIEW